MMDVSRNVSRSDRACLYQSLSKPLLVVIDILTVLLGQPAVAKLLWVRVTSKKPVDILNFNMALFVNGHYLMSTAHLGLVLVLPNSHEKLLKALLVFGQIGGPMGLFFISLERYVAVLHPTSYPLLKTYRYREVCAAAVWFCSLLIALTLSFVNERTPAEVDTMLRALPLGVMLIAIHMMVYCSFCISRALRKSGPGQDKLHPVKKRAFTTVRTTAALTFCCYMPVTVLQNTKFIKEPEYQCLYTAVILLFLSAASVVHPLFNLYTQGELLTCRKTSTHHRSSEMK